MKLKEDSTEQKLRGAYYTPLPLAEMMVELFRDDETIKEILEPSCGDGVFIDGLIKTGYIEKIASITAIEIEKSEAKKLRKRVIEEKKVNVLNIDFFDFYKQYSDKKRYDLILGNPPFIRYQYLKEEQRNMMSNVLTSME
jgi:adenine-specific DNA-methyltransferase